MKDYLAVALLLIVSVTQIEVRHSSERCPCINMTIMEGIENGLVGYPENFRVEDDGCFRMLEFELATPEACFPLE